MIYLSRVSLLLAIGWMCILFYLSHQPALGTPSLFPGQDKVFHAGAYGVLGVLLLGSTRLKHGGYTVVQAFLSLTIASLYGISDEFHQSFTPGRTPEVLDWVADTTGAALAIMALYGFSQIRRPVPAIVTEHKEKRVQQ